MIRLWVVCTILLHSACTLRLPDPVLIEEPPTTPVPQDTRAPSNDQLHVPSFPPPRLNDRIIKRSCTLRFNDPDALAKLPNQASDARAYWTQYDGSRCEPNSDTNCWVYKRNCGTIGDIRFEEYPFNKSGNVQLAFEDLNCQDSTTGVYGRKTANVCQTDGIDHSAENRYAKGNDNAQVLRLWVRDEGIPAMFSVDKIEILGSTGDRVFLSIQMLNGTWIGWPNLPPGHYNLKDWAVNIVEMRFRGSPGTQSVAKVDNVRIKRLFVLE